MKVHKAALLAAVPSHAQPHRRVATKDHKVVLAQVTAPRHHKEETKALRAASAPAKIAVHHHPRAVMKAHKAALAQVIVIHHHHKAATRDHKEALAAAMMAHAMIPHHHHHQVIQLHHRVATSRPPVALFQWPTVR